MFCDLKPAGVLITAAIASHGTKSPLISSEEGGNVYNKVHSANAGRKCVSVLTGAFGNNHYVFSYNGDPAQTADFTKVCCKEQFSGFRDRTVWPPFMQLRSQPYKFYHLFHYGQ